MAPTAKITLVNKTTDTWQYLKSGAMPVPDGIALPQFPSQVCLKDTATCKKETNRQALVPKGVAVYHQATSWDPKPMTDWIFTASPPLIGKNLNLAIVQPAAVNYTVRIFGLNFGASEWPMAVAVAIPKDLPANKPPAFLLYLQNTPMQDPSAPYYKHFEPPYGWDWLYFQFWRWMNYGNAPIRDPWATFGLPFQLTQAGKPYVLVMPQMPLASLTKDPTRFRLLSGNMIKQMLEIIQTEILPGPPIDTLGHVAIAAFSDANNILTSILTDNLAGKAAAEDRNFFQNTVRELFIFDPPEAEWSGNGIIDAALTWKAAAASPTPAKVIRFYAHAFYQNYYKLLPEAKKVGLAQHQPFFGETAAKDITLAYVPNVPATDNLWLRACKKYFPNDCRRTSFGFEDAHHTVPALFLTDAARRSPFF